MSDAPKTVWYRNVLTGAMHEIIAGSDTEKRVRRDLIEQDGEQYGEKLYEKLSDAEVKKAQAKPEQLPGYRAPRPTAEQKKRDELLEAAVLAAKAVAGQDQPPADPPADPKKD